MNAHREIVRSKNSFLPMVLLFLIVNPLYADDSWEVVRDEQGIEVSLSNVSGSEYKMFRGETVMMAQAETVMNVLTEVDSCHLWRFRCKTYLPLGDDTTFVVNDLPWPLNDRFVITHGVLSDKTTLKITRVPLAELTAEQASQLPDHDGLVEMGEYSGYWKLDVIDNDKVSVRYQIRADPAGSIPAAIINEGVVNNPFNTLLKLRDYVEGLPGADLTAISTPSLATGMQSAQ